MKKKRILLGLGAFAFLGLALASCDNNKMYTVTFYNGTEELGHEEVKNGYNVEVPKAPEQTGKVFNGWYKNAELTEQFDFGSIITGNTSIYARWENLYTVTFKNGSTTLSTATVQDGLAVKKPANPTMDNKVFAGWYSDAECTKEFDFGHGIKKDTTVYAKFVNAAHTVKFMNGTTELSTQEVQENAKVTKPTEVPTREGKRFAYWADDEVLESAYDFNNPIISNKTLYAIFKDTNEFDTMKAATSNIFATDFYTTPEAVKLPEAGAEVTIDNQLKLTTGNVDIEHTTITNTGVYEVFFEVTPAATVNGEAFFQIQGTSAVKTDKTEVFGIRSKKDSNNKIVLSYRLDGDDDVLSTTEFEANKTYKIKVTLDTAEGKASYSVNGATIAENINVSITSISSIKFTCKAAGTSAKSFDDVAINFTEKAADPVVTAKAAVAKKITDYKATEAYTSLSSVVKTYVDDMLANVSTELDAVTEVSAAQTLGNKVDAIVSAEKGVATIRAYSAASTPVADKVVEVVFVGTLNANDIQNQYNAISFAGYNIVGLYKDEALSETATINDVVKGATLYLKVSEATTVTLTYTPKAAEATDTWKLSTSGAQYKADQADQASTPGKYNAIQIQLKNSESKNGYLQSETLPDATTTVTVNMSGWTGAGSSAMSDIAQIKAYNADGEEIGTATVYTSKNKTNGAFTADAAGENTNITVSASGNIAYLRFVCIKDTKSFFVTSVTISYDKQ